MLLQLKNISHSFSSEKQLFSGLSLDINEGSIYALLGSNGSGKTTLFNIITGFIKLQSGEICLKDKNIADLTPYEINRQGMGRTFQDLRLISRLTVKENILLALPGDPTADWRKALLPLGIYKHDLQKLRTIANDILETFFLSDVGDSMASSISFGQQKLLNLACCVANRAELLLLDEPVAGISPHYREQITSLILQLKQEGKTILMIEHNTDFIAATADRFLFLDEGKISAFDTFNQLKNSQQAANAYF